MKTFALLLLLALPGLAIDATETARFLAGFSVDNTSLANFAKVPAWREHANQLDAAWTQSELRQLVKVRAWAATSLGSTYSAATPVFYFFSGPDVLYPLAFYPDAGTYVLCAKEPVGEVADPSQVPPEDLPAALAGLRKALTSLLNYSFFITQDLRSDIKQKHFTGILPVLEILLVRTGAQLVEITPAACDKTGAIALGAEARGGTPGVRIRFKRKEAREQTLYYFSGDLSNGGQLPAARKRFFAHPRLAPQPQRKHPAGPERHPVCALHECQLAAQRLGQPRGAHQPLCQIHPTRPRRGPRQAAPPLALRLRLSDPAAQGGPDFCGAAGGG